MPLRLYNEEICDEMLLLKIAFLRYPKVTQNAGNFVYSSCNILILKLRDNLIFAGSISIFSSEALSVYV